VWILWIIEKWAGGLHERRNERLDSVRAEEFLDQVNDYLLLKKGFSPWSGLVSLVAAMKLKEERNETKVVQVSNRD
jgi:hypothetical protein